LMGIVTFGNTDTASDESEDWYFCFEITESFADIYSKIIEKIFQNSVYRDSIDHIEVFC
jgi:hypothetical protein